MGFWVGWSSCGVGFGILGHVHIAGTVLKRSIFRGLLDDSRIPWTYWTGWGDFRRSVVL